MFRPLNNVEPCTLSGVSIWLGDRIRIPRVVITFFFLFVPFLFQGDIRHLKHGAILYNKAEVFSLSITNPNGCSMLPFDWHIPSGLILASCHRILFFCRFSAVEK